MCLPSGFRSVYVSNIVCPHFFMCKMCIFNYTTASPYSGYITPGNPPMIPDDFSLSRILIPSRSPHRNPSWLGRITQRSATEAFCLIRFSAAELTLSIKDPRHARYQSNTLSAPEPSGVSIHGLSVEKNIPPHFPVGLFYRGPGARCR